VRYSTATGAISRVATVEAQVRLDGEPIDPRHLDEGDVPEKVLHEPNGSQVNDIEIWDLVEPFFKVVARDNPSNPVL
jgi:hypothetical protein